MAVSQESSQKPKKSSHKTLRWILGIIGFLIIAVLAVPFLIPLDRYKGLIEQRATQALGRPLHLDGPLSFSILPRLAFELNDVRLEGLSTPRAPDLFKAKKIEAVVALGPLLRKSIQVQHFILVKPEIRLEVDARGVPNWQLRSQTEQPASESHESEKRSAGETLQILDRFQVARFQIEDGLFSYSDVRTRTVQILNDVQADIRLPGLDAPARAKISAKSSGRPFSLDAKVDSPRALTKEKGSPVSLTLKLDQVTADGKVNVSLTEPRPSIRGEVKLSKVDFDHFFPEKKGLGSSGSGRKTSEAGWSREPLNLPALKTLDADLKINAAGAVFHKADIGPTTATVFLKDGHLNTKLAETSIFQGSVSGDLDVNAAANVPVVGLKANLAHIQVEPMLRALANFKRLTGTGEGQISISSTGDSMYAFVQHADGNGQFKVVDGAIKGINLAKMMRNVTSAFLTDQSTERTDFAEINSQFTMTNGLMHSTSNLQAPALRVTGSGQIDLPPQRVNYRLEPKLVGTLKGQGGKTDLAGLEVPVNVTGTFDDLHFAPDLTGVLNNVTGGTVKALGQGLGEGLESTGKGLKGAADDVFKGLFGK